MFARFCKLNSKRERWGYAFGRQESIPLSPKGEQSHGLIIMDSKTAHSDLAGTEIMVTETEVVIRAWGEIIGPTYTRLADQIREGIAHGKLPIIIHFQQATWIESKSLSLLHKTGQQMILSQRSLTVHIAAETQPFRVLKMSQIDQLLLLLSERNMPGHFSIVSHPVPDPQAHLPY